MPVEMKNIDIGVHMDCVFGLIDMFVFFFITSQKYYFYNNKKTNHSFLGIYQKSVNLFIKYETDFAIYNSF